MKNLLSSFLSAKTVVLAGFALLLPLLCIAQTDPDCCCCIKRDLGQKAYDKGDYKKAQLKWEEGQDCSDADQCPDLAALAKKAKAKIPKPAKPAGPSAVEQQADAAWEFVKESNDVAVLQKFADKYPKSRHATEARTRMRRLKPAAEASTPVKKKLEEAPILPGFAFVKGGTYQMGDLFGDGDERELPVHTVTVSDFYLAKNELSFDEFDAFCTATGHDKPNDSGERGRLPVIHVNWYDAIEYCNWRSQQEYLTPVYTINKTVQDPNNQDSFDTKKWLVTCEWNANGYRLPTEAEWEYAAREGGKKIRFGNGKDIASPWEMNFSTSKSHFFFTVGPDRKSTVAVDALISNSLGLKHMSGNVSEWCWDWYKKDYYSQTDGAKNPHGPISAEERVLRGGEYLVEAEYCRATFRLYWDAGWGAHFIGFRLARHL